MADKLTARQKDHLAKLQDEYSIHDALGATNGDGTCSDCEMYVQHGIHWDSCGNRGKIHMGWCSIEAWEKFRADWLAEFGEDPDWKQTARRKVEDAIKKGAMFRTDITEVTSFKEEPVPEPADVPKNTVAWIRTEINGEWMLAIAQGSAWHYMLATNDRITGSISPLSAIMDMRIVQRPEEEPKPNWRRENFVVSEPAVRANPEYAMTEPASHFLAAPEYATLKDRKPFKDGNEIEHPAHYNMFPVEAIDVCEHLGFNLGNVVKYVMRADFKGSKIKDLKKALFYLRREIGRTE